MKRIFTICFLSFLFIFGACFNGYAADKIAAQETVNKAVAAENGKTEDNDNFDFKQIAAFFTEIEENLRNDNFTRQSLEEASVFLNETDLALENDIRKLEKDLNYAQDALAAFGEEAAGGENDAAIAEMKEKYTSNVTAFKNKLIEANLLRAEAARLDSAINEARGRILIGNLVAEKNALIVPRTFWRSIGDFVIFFWNITASPVEWYQGLDDDGRKELSHRGWYVLLILGLALTFGLFVRSYLIRHWGYRRTEDVPGYGQKVVVAIVTALAYGVIPSLLIGGCLFWGITNEDLIATKFGVVIMAALYYALYVILGRAAARVVLAPGNGRWRLFNISDARAEHVFSAVALSIFLCGFGAYFNHLGERFEASVELQLLLDVAMDFIKAFVIILITVAVFGDLKTKAEDKADELAETSAQDVSETEDNDGMSTGVRMILFATVFSLATFSVSLFGYPDLASFIFNRFFASIFLVGMFVVIRTMIFDILKRSIIFWIRTYKMRRRLLSKVDLLMSFLITPILLAVLIYFMLRLWGMPRIVLMYGIKKLVFGFKVGGIYISLLAILTGVLVFIVALTISKMFRRKLNNSLLNRINMDEGIKHTLLSVVSFTGFLIAVILAMIAMGVDLSNLAVIAGALSVGIGFGLQDVIKNFVSGIILLFERPFKVGDWVILGGEEGKIKQINIRSTELETWTKRSVIIPNATLLSSSLVNLTHGDNWQRQSIVVGVSYDSDVDKVTALLLECAKENRKVARVPAPIVLFKDFGASSLDFELRFHVSNVQTDWGVNSDLRYAILKKFREEGIEIAYPQLDIHQR